MTTLKNDIKYPSKMTRVHGLIKPLLWRPSSKLFICRGVPPAKSLGLTQSSMAPKLQSFWQKRLAFQLVGVCAIGWQLCWRPLKNAFISPPPFAPVYSVTTFPGSAGIKNLCSNSWWNTQNLGVDIFPYPIGYFGPPGNHFRFCRQCCVAGGERVPPAPLCWC